MESAFERGDALQVQDKDGQVLDQWKTRTELYAHLDSVDAEADKD